MKHLVLPRELSQDSVSGFDLVVDNVSVGLDQPEPEPVGVWQVPNLETGERVEIKVEPTAHSSIIEGAQNTDCIPLALKQSMV